MTNTFKLILLPVGGLSGAILALALKQGQVLSEGVDGRWIAAGVRTCRVDFGPLHR